MPKKPATIAQSLGKNRIAGARAHGIRYIHMSPAMASRFSDRLWDIGDIVNLIEEWEARL